jgi:hypothetical protein
MPWFRESIASLSPWIPGFVGYVEDTALISRFFSKFFSFPLSAPLHQFYTSLVIDSLIT